MSIDLGRLGILVSLLASAASCKFPPPPEIVDGAVADGQGDDAQSEVDASMTDGLIDAGPPCARRVAFSDFTSSNGLDVYAANLDGTGVVDLSLHAIDDDHPNWSRTGDVVLFDSYRSGSARDIFSINADGSMLRNVTQSAADDHFPVWSPDGNLIAHLRRTTGSPRVWVMDPSGANAREIAMPSVFEPPSWSPGSDRVAFYSNDGDTYTVAVAGGTPTNLTTWTTDRCREPVWSHDGTRIAFSCSSDNGRADIFVVKSDGTDPMNITTTPTANDYSPTWLPDGSLVYSSDRDGASFKIYRSTSTQPLATNTASATAGDLRPVASPDGARIAFTRQGNATSKLGIMNIDGTNLTEFSVISSMPKSTNPTWSPCR